MSQTLDSTLKRYLLYSLGGHLVLVLLIWLGPKLFSFSTQKPYRIVWVQLPQGVGTDIEKIKKAQGLPRSTIKEQEEAAKLPKDLPEKENTKPVTQPTTKPADRVTEKSVEKPVEKPLPPTAKSTKEKPHQVAPEKAVTKPTKKPSKPALSPLDKQIQAALHQNQETLTKAPIESAQVDETGKGAGSKNAHQSSDITDPLLAQYYALVKERINREWIIAPKTFDAASDLHAEIVVMIDKDGTVVANKLEKSSGNYSFDQSAQRAIERASPLPTPPEQLQKEAVEEGFLIEFSPMKVEK